MSGAGCCFLTCMQISQEASKVVWYSHLFKKFPQFLLIHAAKGFGVISKTEVDAFLEFSCFSTIQWMLVIWSPVPLPFLFYFFWGACLHFILFFLILFYFITLHNCIILPNIKMNPPQAHMCSPSWTLFPPPSPHHPSGSSQCTSPKHPASRIEPGLAAHFLHDILHV